jgi:hypothetical protein
VHRAVDVTITAPSGKVIWEQKRVWQDMQPHVTSEELGTYKLWYAVR